MRTIKERHRNETNFVFIFYGSKNVESLLRSRFTTFCFVFFTFSLLVHTHTHTLYKEALKESLNTHTGIMHKGVVLSTCSLVMI